MLTKIFLTLMKPYIPLNLSLAFLSSCCADYNVSVPRYFTV